MFESPRNLLRNWVTFFPRELSRKRFRTVTYGVSCAEICSGDTYKVDGTRACSDLGCESLNGFRGILRGKQPPGIFGGDGR
jgi:hypothetical protein